MCGITGFRLRRGDAAAWAADLPRAVESLHHRGPDDGGRWLSADGMVGLGHRRLSILDLSAHGHQPMFSADGRWAMVFNGEVYNFRDIRAELQGLGHAFAGSGDSEVILAAFAQWGVEAVSRFIGMFAIALWSHERRRLYLLRDRLGVKPLYYGWSGGALFFGSELKALRAFGGWRPEIDRDALTDYFRYGYIAEPRSIYRDVFKLRPGHWLEVGDDGDPVETCYWSVLTAAAQPRRAGSDDELADELEALMTSAFDYRMIADVPVGVFLSGGIDSSVLAAILARGGTRHVKTFTIGFDEEAFNEAPYAEAVARHLGTEQHTRILQVGEAMRILPLWGDLYDEPFGDSSGIPTLLVSRVAAEQVKVVLSADGGDELFSGYNSYASLLKQTERMERLPSWLRRTVGAALGAVPWGAMDDALATQRWPGRINHALRYKSTVRFSTIGRKLTAEGAGGLFDQTMSASFWPDHELQRLLGAAGRTRANVDAYAGEVGERLCLWDLQNYLPGDILTKVDRATMRASIEGRDPLIDHRLVEFAFSLPFTMRRGSYGPKHLLRKVLYRHVPRELIDRPKRGFSIPLGDWLSGGMRPLVDCHLEPSRIRTQGVLDPDMVAAVLVRFRAGDKLSVNKVWLLLAFQMWHARWMEGAERPCAAVAGARLNEEARRPLLAVAGR